MTLSYEDIFSYFRGSISDYKLASLDISDANALLTEYLHKAFAEPYIGRLFNQLSLDDDIQIIEFELKTVVNEFSDIEFVKSIISKQMTVVWLEPQVKKTSLLHQMITSSKESKFYSQSSHLAELKDLYENSILEVRSKIRDRGYIYNSYLEDK